jgi:hypothetical protein
VRRAAVLALVLLLLGLPARALEPLGERGLAVVNGGGGEVFVTPVPVTWQLVRSSRSDRLVHFAWLPEGQTPGAWSDKVSLQLFPGRTDVSGQELLDQIARRYQRDCRDLLASRTETTRKRGARVTFRFLGCTRHADTGRGELALFRVVAGAQALYLVQRAWRTPPFDRETLPFDRAVLGMTRLGLQGGRLCRRQPVDPGMACPEHLRPAIQGTSPERPVAVLRLGDGEK